MRLRDLDTRGTTPTIVLLQTPSSRLTMFLQDKIKRRYGCSAESSLDIAVKSDYKSVKEVYNAVPPFSERWYVSINLDKTNDKELYELIKQSSTCVFFCTCSRYTTFKTFREEFKGMAGFCDFYMNFLRKTDFVYLYDAFTLADNKLSKQMFDYVVQSYSSDIEAVFELLVHLNQGEKFETRNEIAEVCGLGSLSVESYIFSLLKPLSGSDKGLLTVIKNRSKAGIELGESVGYTSMYNFMAKSLLLFCELKMLIMSGVVYKSVRHLPDAFDEKALARYQKYIRRLNGIPLSSLLRIRQAMGKTTWHSDLDLLCFVYNYYQQKAIGGIKNGDFVRS